MRGPNVEIPVPAQKLFIALGQGDAANEDSILCGVE